MLAPQTVTRIGRMGLAFYETSVQGMRFIGHDGATMAFFSHPDQADSSALIFCTVPCQRLAAWLQFCESPRC
jgi:hypothetical protein